MKSNSLTTSSSIDWFLKLVGDILRLKCNGDINAVSRCTCSSVPLNYFTVFLINKTTSFPHLSTTFWLSLATCWEEQFIVYYVKNERFKIAATSSWPSGLLNKSSSRYPGTSYFYLLSVLTSYFYYY